MDLAPVLGVVQVSVSKRVQGRTPLTLSDIHRLARYWDVSPQEFLPTSVSESAWTRPWAGQSDLAWAA